MEYITAKEAAKKWNVHIRIVQTYCVKGRIPEAKKLSRMWIIPADALKPKDPRHEPKSKLQKDTSVFLGETWTFLPGHADEAAAEASPEERILLAHELAYYRGDFDMACQCSRQIHKNSHVYPTALLFSAIAYICMGNHAAFTRCEKELKTLCKEKSAEEHLVRHVQFIQAILDISIYASHRLPDWLKNGELSVLPPQVRLCGFQHYVKYLQYQGEFDKMLAIANTALAFGNTPMRYTTAEIYLKLYAALGNLREGHVQAAEQQIREAMHLALPDGLIMPFAENLTTLRGLIESCMKEEYPQYLVPTLSKWESIFPHWIRAHNECVKEDITLILTRREYQLALYAADRLTNKEIAQRTGLSTESVKEYFRVVYQKLGISSRTELNKYVL